MSLYDVIVKPIVTEKAALLEEVGSTKTYTVEVSSAATKVDVKNAFKLIYGVDAESVNIVKTRAKFKHSKKGLVHKRRESKKAYVTLAENQSVDFSEIK